MKASQLAAVALAAALFPALASAQQDSTAAKSAQQQPISVEQFDQEMAKAQENLKKMQEQMSQIQKASDPAQRQKLMQEHQTMMQRKRTGITPCRRIPSCAAAARPERWPSASAVV